MHRRFFCLMLTLVMLFTVVSPVWAYDSTTGAALAVEEIMDYIYQNHIDKPEIDQLAEGAITGMLERVNDPYTEYLSEDLLEEYKEMLDGDFVGVGIRLQDNGENPVVLDIIPDSPAAHADIKPGDVINKVDGEDVSGLMLDEVVARIRGPEGSDVTLILRRDSQDVKVTLKRAPVSSPTVDYSKLSGDIGYIAIHSFGSQTAGEFARELDRLNSEGVKGLILDLRDSPGGYLQAAVDIAGNFLKDDSLVLTTEDRDAHRDEYRTEGSPRWNGAPLVILVNSLSASSSEVLAGALQDYGQAVLLGETTYGKGVVQSIIPLETGGALKLTTARYLTPKGRSIDGKGLEPDIRVLTRDLQLVRAKSVINAVPETVVKFKLNDNKASVNGEEIILQAAPFRKDGVVYLPLRFAMEALGYAVTWNNNNNSIEVKGTGENMQLFLNRPQAVFNGAGVSLKDAVTDVGGISFIPLDPNIPGVTMVDLGNEITLAKAGRK
ncbi:S41 family peptidase [Desulfocucumis palustris]|uniref:S41 family peptidase n=1 Tax=Desulfocucumis palustris TaxID=1898651 RepID=UPI0013FD671C|nr:S41 family peptidase [Desulfocucumis palustris]